MVRGCPLSVHAAEEVGGKANTEGWVYTAYRRHRISTLGGSDRLPVAIAQVGPDLIHLFRSNGFACQ